MSAPRNAALWVDTFIEAQAAELDAAQNTQLAYARDLMDFVAWSDAPGNVFSAVTKADVEAYLIHCEAQGLAASTRAIGSFASTMLPPRAGVQDGGTCNDRGRSSMGTGDTGSGGTLSS